MPSLKNSSSLRPKEELSGIYHHDPLDTADSLPEAGKNGHAEIRVRQALVLRNSVNLDAEIQRADVSAVTVIVESEQQLRRVIDDVYEHYRLAKMRGTPKANITLRPTTVQVARAIEQEFKRKATRSIAHNPDEALKAEHDTYRAVLAKRPEDVQTEKVRGQLQRLSALLEKTEEENKQAGADAVVVPIKLKSFEGMSQENMETIQGLQRRYRGVLQLIFENPKLQKDWEDRSKPMPVVLDIVDAFHDPEALQSLQTRLKKGEKIAVSFPASKQTPVCIKAYAKLGMRFPDQLILTNPRDNDIGTRILEETQRILQLPKVVDASNGNGHAKASAQKAELANGRGLSPASTEASSVASDVRDEIKPKPKKKTRFFGNITSGLKNALTSAKSVLGSFLSV